MSIEVGTLSFYEQVALEMVRHYAKQGNERNLIYWLRAFDDRHRNRR